MADMIHFSNVRLRSDRKGIITPDSCGYRTVVLGGLGIMNSQGQFYSAEDSVKALFSKSSSLRRRIEKGVLKSEVGHPEWNPKLSDEENFDRNMNIDPLNVCAHISDIWIDEHSVKQVNGKDVIAIMGKVIPSGPHAEMLERSFNNPKENVCFSIRAISVDSIKGGQYVKRLHTIYTFDYVTEGGIIIAEKYSSPAMEHNQDKYIAESEQDVAITKDRFIQAYNNMNKIKSPMSVENSKELGKDLMQSLGWNLDSSVTPVYTKW